MATGTTDHAQQHHSDRDVVRVINVHKSFGSTEVLRNMNLSLSIGEVVVIVGPSGSGKSTLLRCINGLEDIQTGEIFVAETKVVPQSLHIYKIRQQVGMIFQSFNLFPPLTALQTITLA